MSGKSNESRLDEWATLVGASVPESTTHDGQPDGEET
jgi:hypothetical protein